MIIALHFGLFCLILSVMSNKEVSQEGENLAEKVPMAFNQAHGDGDVSTAERSVRKARKRTCSFQGCGATSRKLHIIPKNEPLRGMWIQGSG